MVERAASLPSLGKNPVRENSLKFAFILLFVFLYAFFVFVFDEKQKKRKVKREALLDLCLINRVYQGD